MTMGQFFMMTTVVAVSLVSSCKTNDFTGGARRPGEAPAQNSKTFQQLTREQRSATVTQGRPGASSNESYAVTGSGIVDLLIVVDNSASMYEEQDNLSKRMVPLLSAVKNSDWQIAITTTDPSEDCVTTIIKKTDLIQESRFKRAINAGTSGTGYERPILRAVNALKPSCKSWVRPNSTLGVLIITDEDDCYIGGAGQSQSYGCVGEASTNASYLTDYLRSIRTLGSDAKVFGLFWHPSRSQAQCSTALKSADKIAEIVSTTGGTWGSICDSDYSATLTTVSQNVAQILKADFNLKSVPTPGSLKLTVNGQNWTDYTLNGTLVQFTRMPPAGATIAVSYVSGAAGIVTNAFDLPSTPLAGSLNATVGSAPAGTVTWDASRNKAVFTQTPAAGSTITINYKEDTVLKDSFAIATGATSVNATINGERVDANSFTYDANTGIVKFKVSPPEASTIVITWSGLGAQG